MSLRLLILGFPGDDDIATGGGIVDRKYRELLSKHDNVSIENLTFEEAGFGYKASTPSEQKKIVETFARYDAVLFDARLFTKFVSTIRYIRANCSTRIYAVMHHFYSLELRGAKRVFIRSLENYVYSRIDGMLFAGEFPYRLAAGMHQFDGVRLRYIGIGFEREETVSREETSNGNIVFVGHVIARKGPQYLVEALRMLAENEGLRPITKIIGTTERDPRFAKNLVRMIVDYGLENTVTLTGRISDDEKADIVRTSGILVFPSLCEGFGMVIIEAMRFGIPAIVFNNTGLPYLVKDGFNGYVVEDKDSAAICERLKRMLTEKNTYMGLSDGAYATYKQSMTWAEVDDNLDAWIEEDLFEHEDVAGKNTSATCSMLCK